MQIYSKSMKNALQICTSGGDVYYASRNLLSTCFPTNCFQVGEKCVDPPAERPFFKMWIGYPIAVFCYCIRG